MTTLPYVAPVVIGVVFVTAMSLVRDHRRRLTSNAALTVGVSGIYLSAGTFGPWELLAAAVVFGCAYRGLHSWRWVAVAWLLHACLDVAHAVRGVELLPWAPRSSLGCAICDPVIALWCLSGGRPLDQIVRGAPSARAGATRHHHLTER